MSVKLTAAQIQAQKLGFNGNVPKDATSVKKDDNGIFSVTVNGQTKKYNADGTPYSDSSAVNGNNNGGTPLSSVGSPSKSDGNPVRNGNVDGSVFNYSSVMNMNGGFNIDPTVLAGAAMNTDAIINIGANIPFGIGGQMTSGSLFSNMQDYMNSVSFNFDFSNLIASAEQRNRAAQQSIQPAVSPSTPISDGNGNTKTVAELAKDGGYVETETSGIYKKGNKYYKYDVVKKMFVEASNAEAKAAKEADKNKADEVAAAKKKERLQKEAQNICDEISDAVRSAFGTDNDKLKAAVKKINKNNVVEVMDAWKESSGKSLMETIQGEFHWYDGGYGLQHELEKHLMGVLSKRAEDDDLVSDAGNFRRAVNNELNATVYSSDSSIREAFDTMHSKIKEKEG